MHTVKNDFQYGISTGIKSPPFSGSFNCSGGLNHILFRRDHIYGHHSHSIVPVGFGVRS